MKKVVMTFGLISGAIIAVLVWLIAWLCETGAVSLDDAELIGYASMLIALAMVFFGMKSYRDNYSDGKMTFWKGVQVGLLISLLGALCYWVSAAAYNVVNPGFNERWAEKYTEQTVGEMRERGASHDEIETSITQIRQMQEFMKNPLLFFLVALIEVLPVGIVVTVISALLLRQKDVLPAGARI